ncbi:uncharacterized protein METZ01_LOCUS393216, partial [marine metagenome]
MRWRDIDPERVRILISHYPDNYPHESFHPKVYSFSNAENAQVFVGSNNLTRGGLVNNREVSAEMSGVIEENIHLRNLINDLETSNENPRCRILEDLQAL